MGDRDIPTVGDQGSDVMICLAGSEVLIFDRLMIFVCDEGVAADGDHDTGHDYSIAPSTRASSAIRMTTPL